MGKPKDGWRLEKLVGRSGDSGWSAWKSPKREKKSLQVPQRRVKVRQEKVCSTQKKGSGQQGDNHFDQPYRKLELTCRGIRKKKEVGHGKGSGKGGVAS